MLLGKRPSRSRTKPKEQAGDADVGSLQEQLGWMGYWKTGEGKQAGALWSQAEGCVGSSEYSPSLPTGALSQDWLQAPPGFC